MCMVALPIFVAIFFTTLMEEGQPVDMPIGVVDYDRTTTTRRLARMIDAFQSSHVVGYFEDVESARKAIQRNEIYGFIEFPEHMTQDLLSARQPHMSVYYSNTALLAGSLLYKDMEVLCTLASAAVGKATMQAKGVSEVQAMALLQPIKLDTHNITNPWVNYNMYLSAMMIPACLMLFIFLITGYALGTELKFGTHKEWLEMADGNIVKALAGKILPHTVIFLIVMYSCMAYMYGYMQFPAPGGIWRLMLLGFLAVVAAQGFGLFLYGLIPSMRMAMSICSLWGVLSFSMVGSAFPVFAMDAPLQTASLLFPMRHYYLIYQLCITNTFPLTNVLPNILVLVAFAVSPVFVLKRMKRTFNEFDYQP